MLFEAHDADFNEKVLGHPIPVLVDFWAPSCKPCLSMGPVLEILASDMENRMSIAKVNVDENQLTAKAHKVRGLPTLMIFRDGEMVDKKLGAMTGQQIRDWLMRSLGAGDSPVFRS